MLVTGFIVSQRSWGWIGFQFFGDPFTFLAILLLSGWLMAAFVPVALAIADGGFTRIGTAFAFVVAVAGTFLVPILTSASIENDPSSTAVLIHLYDPLPVILAVGLVFGLDYLSRQFANRSVKPAP